MKHRKDEPLLGLGQRGAGAGSPSAVRACAATPRVRLAENRAGGLLGPRHTDALNGAEAGAGTRVGCATPGQGPLSEWDCNTTNPHRPKFKPQLKSLTPETPVSKELKSFPNDDSLVNQSISSACFPFQMT